MYCVHSSDMLGEQGSWSAHIKCLLPPCSVEKQQVLEKVLAEPKWSLNCIERELILLVFK